MPFLLDTNVVSELQNMAVATRNIRDFENIDIEVVDPWATA